jgi:hypothetical protein
MCTGHDGPVLGADVCSAFRASGFVVLRDHIDPTPLSDEVDRTFVDGLRTDAGVNTGSAGIGFRYVPMMCERTPVSLALVDALAAPAEELLGRRVLPVRAKCTRYVGGSDWHRDSELDVASMGFVAYLEPLTAGSGALRVQPGSHTDATAVATGDGTALDTRPGDVIAFDEHLMHGSAGGDDRRQWRVDFVGDPETVAEAERVRSYFSLIYPVDWDGGYDIDRFPSYGAYWVRSNRPWTERLRALGVYAYATAQENAARVARSARS